MAPTFETSIAVPTAIDYPCRSPAPFLLDVGAHACSRRVPRAELDADPAATPEAAFEVVACFDDPGPSGFAARPGGRVFVSFPRHAIDHDRATLGALRGGALAPFPTPP